MTHGKEPTGAGPAGIAGPAAADLVQRLLTEQAEVKRKAPIQLKYGRAGIRRPRHGGPHGGIDRYLVERTSVRPADASSFLRTRVCERADPLAKVNYHS